MGSTDSDIKSPALIASSSAVRQPTQDLSADELKNLAEELGLEATQYKTRQHLRAAVDQRRKLIDSMDRQVLVELVQWGRRSVPNNASKEHLVGEVTRIRLMRFDGLSQPALLALALLRGVNGKTSDDSSTLKRKLKKREGFFARMGRKRRAFIGSLVSNMIGGDETDTDYRFASPTDDNTAATSTPAPPATSRSVSIKEEIEEAGLFGGIAGRIKKSADSYLNQKLDEIESRIDRKLDEIDRRLAEWRDKEIANRIRILKITLWASVIVSLISLIYFYLKVYVLN
ncbi:MAG: hypothetical protein IT448_01870 [Phycisphaerales bacterium]|nr:hypothetical protein [Phycisphaerales bacterium]